jgi:CubicO group peptidase (beta-lactamase class C family)
MSDRIRAALAEYVGSGALPGAAWWVSRDGDVSRGELGTSHPGGAGEPVRPDTLFRISSTTKPVTAVVAMTLVDDGTLSLDDPVQRWLPELADRQVLVDPQGDLTHTVPADRPILVQDLLEFRLGLGYDFSGAPTPVLDALEQAGVHMGPPAPQANPDPDAWMALFARVPLMYQPGDRWLYNTGAEVLGVLVARASGSTFPELLRRRVLDPLDMNDTAFSVAPADLARLGPVWAPGQDGGDAAVYDQADGQWSRPPAFPNGADGLVSTVDDLAAFGSMLLNGGRTASGVPVLRAETVDIMTTSRMTIDENAGVGWGLGLGVITTDSPDGRHAGTYGWEGGLGTSWWNDPVSRTTAVLLTNQMWPSPSPPDVIPAFWRAAFGS